MCFAQTAALLQPAALLLQCGWYSIRVGALSPTLGRSPTADVGAHYKGGHPIWAAYRVALNSYRVGAPYNWRHPIRAAYRMAPLLGRPAATGEAQSVVIYGADGLGNADQRRPAPRSWALVI